MCLYFSYYSLWTRSIPGCKISSLLDKNLSGGQLPHVLWRWPVDLLSKKKKCGLQRALSHLITLLWACESEMVILHLAFGIVAGQKEEEVVAILRSQTYPMILETLLAEKEGPRRWCWWWERKGKQSMACQFPILRNLSLSLSLYIYMVTYCHIYIWSKWLHIVTIWFFSGIGHTFCVHNQWNEFIFIIFCDRTQHPSSARALSLHKEQEKR